LASSTGDRGPNDRSRRGQQSVFFEFADNHRCRAGAVLTVNPLAATPSPEPPNMTNKRPADSSDSFYYRAIRTKIGEALRSQFVPTEPPPKRLLDFLQELDQLKGDARGANGWTDGPAPQREKER
jgi:hypothetical protein